MMPGDALIEAGSHQDCLSIWVIFDHPLDYPDHWVLRRQVVLRSGGLGFDPRVWKADTLAAVREHVPPGLTRLPRQPGDEPQIAECWL